MVQENHIVAILNIRSIPYEVEKTLEDEKARELFNKFALDVDVYFDKQLLLKQFVIDRNQSGFDIKDCYFNQVG